MKQSDQGKHTTQDARRKLTQRVVDNLAPWELKVYKASGRLPKAQQRSIEEHKYRMLYKEFMRSNKPLFLHPHKITGKDWKTHQPYLTSVVG